MKLLGIDYGRKRLGLALCGALKIASPSSLVERTTLEEDINAIRKVSEDYDVEKVVVGLPKNMDNSEGEMAKEAAGFAKLLEEKLGLPVVLWDERLTSFQAEKLMIDAGIARARRRKYCDQIAATLILQSYVDANADLS